MKVLILGGTRFIGRAIVAELAAHGHEVVVVHRGITEVADDPASLHIHVPRRELPAHREQLAELEADVAIDTMALTRADAETASAALPDGIPLVVLSSMDVYAAWDALLHGVATYPVPFDEEAPLRTGRYSYRGMRPDFEDYEKLDVEEIYAAREATICRLPAVYGPHDRQRREEFILGRVRAGRTHIPFGSGNWLWSRLHAADAAAAVRLMVERDVARGETYHLAPRQCLTVRQYAEQILAAAGHEAELVQVADSALPRDLEISAAAGQHLLADAGKARSNLGWEAGATHERIGDSVAWHLAHPPPSEGADSFDEDDAALATAG